MGRSKLSQISSTEFARIVKESTTYREVQQRCGYQSFDGGTSGRIKTRIERDGLDVSHFRRAGSPPMPLKDAMVRNSTYKNSNLKKRLLKEGLLVKSCAVCGIGNEWQGKRLVLQFHHVNGITNDHRMENLQLLCPNCHSQTDSYTGKNCKNPRRVMRKKRSGAAPPQRKFDVSRRVLAELVWEKPTTEVARQFGVSDQAVAKRCRKLGIEKPPRGYWQKKRAGK